MADTWTDTIYLRKGNLLPILEATLSNPDGTAMDLTGASSVTVYWRPSDGRTGKSGTCTVTNAAAGTVSYAWVSGDTDVAATHYIEFKVVFAGKSITLPNDDNQLKLVITDSQG